MLPFPPADSPSNPIFPANLLTAPFPTKSVVKKSIPMCLACTALLHLHPRPDIMMQQTVPQLSVHYVWDSLLLDKPGWIHFAPHGQGRTIPSHMMMPLSAQLFHSDVRFFCFRYEQGFKRKFTAMQELLSIQIRPKNSHAQRSELTSTQLKHIEFPPQPRYR